MNSLSACTVEELTIWCNTELRTFIQQGYSIQLLLQKRQEQNADRAQRREPDAEEMINELVLAGRTGIVQVVWVMKEERSEKKHSGQSIPDGKGNRVVKEYWEFGVGQMFCRILDSLIKLSSCERPP